MYIKCVKIRETYTVYTKFKVAGKNEGRARHHNL